MNKLFGIFLLLLVTASSTLAFPNKDYSDDQDYDNKDTVPEEEEDVGAAGSTDPALPTFRDESRTFAVREGEAVEFSCQTQEPTEHMLILKKLWKSPKDEDLETILYVGTVEVAGEVKRTDNVFSLTGIRREDAGAYVCSYQDSKGSQNELVYTLDVQYPPTVVSESPEEQRVQKGDSVTVECQATGNPVPTITWSKESGHLPSGDNHEEGYNMTLENVDRHVEGSYKCTAENGIGNPVSTSMKIFVEYPPEITTEKAIVRSGEGDVIELVCIVHARPKAEVTWSKDGVPFDHLERGEVTEMDRGHRHTISITNVMEENFGSYRCDAVNERGEDSETIDVTDRPKQPHFTSPSTSAEKDSYTLAWETESYYPITMYTVKYREAGKLNASTGQLVDWIEESVDLSAEENLSPPSPLIRNMKHTIDNLLPATDYESSVSVKNKIKWGEPGDFNFSTRKASPTTTTIATTTNTSTPPPLAEETVRHPHEETTNPQTSSSAAFVALNAVALCASRLALSVLS